jgi:hypothetical protein
MVRDCAPEDLEIPGLVLSAKLRINFVASHHPGMTLQIDASYFRHCEPTGRANARPMTRLREAIQSSISGLLRRFAPRNDGG